jgi:hypothetical protein
MPTSRLRRKAASHYLIENHGLPCAPGTLAKYAVIGGGPVFWRAGRIPLYDPRDLDAFAASKLSGPLRSTSEVRAKGTVEPRQDLCQCAADRRTGSSAQPVGEDPDGETTPGRRS